MSTTKIGNIAIQSAFAGEFYGGVTGWLGYGQKYGQWQWKTSRYGFTTTSPMTSITLHVRWSGGAAPNKPWAAIFPASRIGEQNPVAYERTDLALPLSNKNGPKENTIYFSVSNLSADITFKLKDRAPADNYYIWLWPSNPVEGGYYNTLNSTYSGDANLYANAESSGYVYIANGSTWGTYGAYIDNGSGFSRYIPYIDTGSTWVPYLG